MTAPNNKFLKLQPDVVLTKVIDPVIAALDPYFEAAQLQAWVTSGLRLPGGQLKIIQGYLRTNLLHTQYPEALDCQVEDTMPYGDDGGTIFKWQLGWSALLHAGIIVNPPKAARCLMDYVRDGINKKGMLIHESPHFRGTAFDIGGHKDGIENELAVIRTAFAAGLPGLVGYLPERKQNCLHVDCKSV